MLANIFLLLVCYSVIKTVREPLILLGGGAEVRSYAAAGQALLLMGFVPLYGWCASRVRPRRAARRRHAVLRRCASSCSPRPWPRACRTSASPSSSGSGIFNMSLVAQFWSFANDIYSKEAGDRLFPIIMIGMTAGAPLGSLVAARLFRLGHRPAGRSCRSPRAAPRRAARCSTCAIDAAASARTPAARRPPLAAGGGFSLVLAQPLPAADRRCWSSCSTS